jgi:putative intracellular protease/amidase
MTIKRRSWLLGAGTTALLGPWMRLAQAAERTPPKSYPSTNSADIMTDEHMQAMRRAVGPGIWGEEQIAMLLYPGFTALDLVGPHYFFACLFGAKVHLVTTEKDLAPVPSDLGLAIAPSMTLPETPGDLDLLFFPGGTQGTLAVMQNPATMQWISAHAARSRFLTSVCTGSMILAKAGLLRGRRATSHWATRAALADFGATPVDARVVEDGNVVTGAGVSAGIDFALAIVEKLRGRPYAQALMLQAEYSPAPPFDGGTLASTPGEVAQFMDDMLKPIAEQFRALASPRST